MAQHGYLREYDEAPDRSDDRDRDWEDRDRERSWRGGEQDWSDRDRDRGIMFDRDDHRRSNRHQRQGFSEPVGDRAGSRFRDDDRQFRGTHEDSWSNRSGTGYRGEQGFGGYEGDHRSRDRHQGGFGSRGDTERSQRMFSSHQDDHYLSWRERQMAALDKDYADYCREREQQFHSDFDKWRQTKQQGAGQQGGHGKAEAGQAAELELTHERALAGQGNTPSPAGDATLGTNNSENTSPGRR